MLGLMLLFPFVGLTIARLMEDEKKRPNEWTERFINEKQTDR